MATHEHYQVKRVFIASPGDLAEERKLFPDVLKHVNNMKAHGLGIHLEPLGWEDTLPGMGRPQALINDDVRKCDLFVMLLWKRWGTPSGEYSSGSEEEFELARNLRAEHGKPEDIWLYCRSVPDEMLADPGEQLSKVLEFRKNIEAQRTCLYKWYSETCDWQEALTTHLCQWLDRTDRPISTDEPSVDIPAEIQSRLQALEQQLKHKEEALESAQGKLRRSAIDMALRGMKAAEEGHPTEAEQQFATALQMYPEPQVMNMYAIILQQRGDAGTAEVMYRKALEIDPEYAYAWSNLGVLLGKTDRRDEEEQAYRKAIECDPKCAKAWYNLGILLWDTHRQDEAEKAYRKAIEIDPQYANAWHNLGALLGKTDRQDEAAKAFRKAIEIDPNDVDTWCNLGVLLGKTHRQDEAEKAFRKAIEIDPQYANAWYNLGGLLGKTDRQDEAEKAYRKAIEIDPQYANAWSNLGVLLGKTDCQDEEEQAYRKAIECDPKHADAWHNLGGLLEETDRQDEAEQAFRKAIQCNPKDASNYYALAYVLWSVGRVDDAEVEVGKALELDPNCAYAHATLGLLKFEKNDLDGGREGYAKAIELEPHDKPLRQKYHFEYGRALARNGREDEAREQFEAALSTDATYVPKEQIEAELAKLP